MSHTGYIIWPNVTCAGHSGVWSLLGQAGSLQTRPALEHLRSIQHPDHIAQADAPSGDDRCLNDRGENRIHGFWGKSHLAPTLHRKGLQLFGSDVRDLDDLTTAAQGLRNPADIVRSQNPDDMGHIELEPEVGAFLGLRTDRLEQRQQAIREGMEGSLGRAHRRRLADLIHDDQRIADPLCQHDVQGASCLGS